MKRLLLALALLASLPAFAQETPIYCVAATLTVCNTISNPGNHYQGDPGWLIGGKVNAWGSQLGLFANQPANEVLATPSGATGIPGVRALVGADIPPINLAGGSQNGGVAGILPASDGGTGLGAVTANDCLAGNTGGTGYIFLPCAAAQVYPAAGLAISTGTAWGTSITLGTGMSSFLGLTWPSLISSDCLTNNGTALSWGACGGGSGTVTDGAGTTTANELLASSTRAHTYTVVSTLPTAAMPALTGDVTSSAGSTATTVSKVNGASVPPNLGCASTNGSSQFTAGCHEAVNAQTGTTYTIATTDCGSQVTFGNAGAIAVSLPQANGSFASCQFDVTDIGAGTATITPTTSTINGAASLAVAQNRQCTVNSDGTNWQVIGCTALVSGGGSGQPQDIQTFSASGTWTKPAWASSDANALTKSICTGSGGGGGSGAVEPSGTAESGGTGGGGGATVEAIFPTSGLTGTVSVTVGAGGTGGSAVSATGNGNAGGNGNSSSFGSYLTAFGGGGGAGGSTGSPAGGGGAGLVGGATGVTGGPLCGTGGSNGVGAAPSCAGGGGSGAGNTTGGGAGNRGGYSLIGGGGGGSGGGINTTPAASNGGQGGSTVDAVGPAGAVSGASGSPGVNGSNYGGGSGASGGSSSTTGTAGSGAMGGMGAGGSGGGAALNGAGSSGAGGGGGNGECIVITTY